MSRIGNKPIDIPEGVTITLDGQHIKVTGPKGTLERDIHSKVTVEIKDNKILVTVANPKDGNLQGLTRTLIANMVEGCDKEFSKTLQINGVGYKAQKQGKKLVINLGFSHPVEMEEPEGIIFEVPNANTIIVRGANKELVGQNAAVIRSKRPPEPYKGKGIKYDYEHIRRKEGKTGKQ